MYNQTIINVDQGFSPADYSLLHYIGYNDTQPFSWG